MTSLLQWIYDRFRIFPKALSSEDIETIKGTHLFTNLSEQKFNKMLRSIRIANYPQGSVIIQEGSIGDVLYIIIQGTVRVFTHDAGGMKIPLVMLTNGDYFGEQALFGESVESRNANVEATSDIRLLAIPKRFITESLKNNPAAKSELFKEGIREALRGISKSTGLFNDIEALLNSIQKPKIIQYLKDDIVFEAGDKSDYVYIILQGEVTLEFPNRSTKVVLHKGNVLGELGVLDHLGTLRNRTRSATAIAALDTRLLKLSGEDFIQIFQTDIELKKILTQLHQDYQLNVIGSVERYMGKLGNLGPIITTIYALDDGRTITSSHLLDHEVFTMCVEGEAGNKHYQYEKHKWLELIVRDNHLIQFRTNSNMKILPELCRIIIENTPLESATIANIEKNEDISFAVFQ